MLDQSSSELAIWIEYERAADQRNMNIIANAVVQAFNGDKKKKKVVEDDEEIIDTTQPEFAENFKITNITGRG